MLWKNRKKRVGVCLTVVTSCLVLAVVWAILATPETTIAKPPDKPDNPGGNIKQQDISTKVTFDPGSLTGVDGAYIDGESNIDCKTGRRRTIWVNFGKNSNRTMLLTRGSALDPTVGDPILETLPNGVDLPDGAIDQVELSIAVGQNVSGLGEEFVDNVLYCAGTPDPDVDDPADFNCMLTNMRVDFRDVLQGYNWRLYFGPGPKDGGTWPGGFLFSNPDPSLNEYVRVTRTNPSHTGAGRLWKVETIATDRDQDGTPDSVPGFLYFKGTKPNDPHVYVGVFDIPWSCVAESLE